MCNQCVVLTKQASKQTNTMWGDPGMQKISRLPQASFAFWYRPARARALIMTQTHRFVVLYIRLWMWARQVPLVPTAVGWILLQHQYLQCWQRIAAAARLKTTLTRWTLNSLLCPFDMDLLHRCFTGAWCCKAQLTMWMSVSSFLRGARKTDKQFCFKKWK